MSYPSLRFCVMESPLGPLKLCADEAVITHITLCPAASSVPPAADDALLQKAVCQLRQYFAGSRQCFSLPLAPQGTPFQQAVWQQLRSIPYGETRTYGQIAAALGRPGAARAVGGACHVNPILLCTPCHRVCAANGPGGFALGAEAKQLLLRLEAAYRPAKTVRESL